MTESVQPRVDCEIVTQYSPLFLQMLMNISLICATLVIKHYFNTLRFARSLGKNVINLGLRPRF